MATLLISVIYLCFISLGLPDSLLGAAWPVMYEEMHVPISSMGIITMLICGVTILSSLFADRVTRRFSTWAITLVSILLTVLGLFGFSLSTNFFWLCISALPYGLGAGAIDAALNNYVALHFSSRYMSWLHCFWGVGAIISPYIMSYALFSARGWDSGYRMVAYAQLGIALVLALSLPLWRRRTAQANEEEEVPLFTFREKIRTPGVIYILLAFFAYCALEGTLMSWSATYLVDAQGLDEVRAASLSSMFFIGITAGRLISGFITDKLGDRCLIRIGVGIITVGVILLSLPLGSTAALISLVVLGVGCAPIFPSIIHATPHNFGREKSQAVIGLQMSSAYFGSTFMPPAFGLIVDFLGSKWLPIYLALFLVMFIVFSELLNRTVQKRENKNTETT